MGSATTQRCIPLPAILIVLILTALHSAPAMADRTAYEVLRDYNFPVGLLPQGVTGYDLNIMTGDFSVYFGSPCKISINNFHLKYNPTIQGNIANGKISNLQGIYEKRYLVWMGIDEIVRNGDDLVITVGKLSTAFPINYFEQSPPCTGTGVQAVQNLRTNPFGSRDHEI